MRLNEGVAARYAVVHDCVYIKLYISSDIFCFEWSVLMTSENKN